MKLTDYQKKALETVIYPKEYGVVYTALGLVDEIYEFYESIGSDEEIGELSDCCWYIACFAHECEINMQDLSDLADDLNGQINFYDIFDATNQMIGSASRICGLVKKYIRDDGLKMSLEREIKLQVELSVIILSIYYICEKLETTFDYVAKYNIEKLASRKQRGKLGGSGDRR